jgi:saccharopine dehydrogenase (NAD+, L-lysine forming)
MAVDNLPCELPKDASEDFGNELIKSVFPHLLGDDPDNIIGRGSETDLNGNLTTFFAYLNDYVNQVTA